MPCIGNVNIFGAIIATEYNECILGEPQSIEAINQTTDLGIEISYTGTEDFCRVLAWGKPFPPARNLAYGSICSGVGFKVAWGTRVHRCK